MLLVNLKYSRNFAKSALTKAEIEVSDSKKKRDAEIEKKNRQHAEKVKQVAGDPDSQPFDSRRPQELDQQASVMRNRLNKAQREKKEEKYRAVSASLDEISEYFGTTDSAKIREFFDERRKTTTTLQNQIHELDLSSKELELQHSRMRAALEEAAFTSTKGIGGNRLIAEGKELLDKKKKKLILDNRSIVSVEANFKSISSGIIHFTDVLALLSTEEVEPEPISVLQWTKDKVSILKRALQSEETDYLTMCNQVVLADLVAKASANDYDLQHVDSTKRSIKRQVEPTKRAAKDAKHEITSRVLTRQEIKDLAQGALDQKHSQKANSATSQNSKGKIPFNVKDSTSLKKTQVK